MISDSTLLVVDDEQVYCDGCERIFSRQGFRVEGSNDAAEALNLATNNDYAAIILDVKMPNMDGIRFLEHLRATKPDTPVILMTGYPSIQNAASAIRLGASDYVTKPFTPEQITSAVQGLLHTRRAVVDGSRAESTAAVEVESDNLVFHGRGWAHLGDPAAVRVGGVVPRPEAALVELELPRVGDIVHQGLPLLAVRTDDGAMTSIPAPATGMVLEVNDTLADSPDLLWEHPCGLGWVARIAPTRLDDEKPGCQPREVLAVTDNREFLGFYRDKLSRIGCNVRATAPNDDDALLSGAQATGVVVFDAASCGEEGPDLVGRMLSHSPESRVVVVAPAGSPHQERYRAQRLFYYAVPPLEDDEIVEIVDSCYCPPAGRGTAGSRGRGVQNMPISALHIDTPRGKRVSLLVPGGLLQRDWGLGLELRTRLLDRLLPLETGLGDLEMTPARVLREGVKSDRVIVLTTADASRIPGSLVPYRSGKVASLIGVESEKIVVLAIQPVTGESSLANLDRDCLGSLADHIIEEMLA